MRCVGQFIGRSYMKLPKAIRDKFARAGRKGGMAKVKKGFAAMDPERKRQIQSAGGKAKRKPNGQ